MTYIPRPAGIERPRDVPDGLTVHFAHRLPDLLPDTELPLCWVWLSREAGMDPAKWVTAVEEETLDDYAVTSDRAFTTCERCKHWQDRV